MAPLRLLLVATAAGGITVAGGLAGIPAAHATTPPLTATLAQTGSPFSGGDCSDVTAPANVNATLNGGDTITRSITVSGTATSAADSTDKVTLQGTQRITVSSTVSGAQLSSLKITATTAGAVTATKGAASNCTTSSNGTGWNLMSTVQGTLHRTTAGWAHVAVHSAGVGGQEAALQISASGGGTLQGEFGGLALRDIDDDGWIYVPAGDFNVQAGVMGAAATYPVLPKASLGASVTLTFYPAGVAKAAESGTARTMVAFPSALTCATGRASVRLTSKINGAAKVSLLVNGSTKKTIASPVARTVTLTGVPTTQAVTLKAVVRKGGKTLTATRAYRAC